MNTRQPTPLLTTCLTALGAVAASAVLGMNLAEQAETEQKMRTQAARVVTKQAQVQLQKLPTVLIAGRRQA
ncbi:hypothetical protein [Roseateles sp.]|uniref:hypothetical protein n=1 Tax=Roseateles sp. TaxID=1971397 RepID=UPI00286D245E|nr:hypothetical protein [Roseateles sp.]